MNSRKPAYKLVIVESPAKARTISKFLGRNYKVEASQGHVRDLPKSQLGVDVEHDFEPKYITIRGRGEVLERIRKEAKGAKSIILATDPDREGEAISWHLATVLGIAPEEAEAVRAVGGQAMTLGSRILRTETAGLVALTLTLHGAGDLGVSRCSALPL